MADGIERAVKGLITLGIGVFMLVLFLNLSYQEYGTTASNLGTTYGTANGIYKNFTQYAGGVVNAYGSNLNLAVTALVLIAIVIAILYGVRDTGLVGGFVG